MANKRKIYIRADAGPTIGYGHYIRSLALADMLKQDFDCTMFTQMPTDYQLRECESVCPIVALPDDDSKFDTFLDYLKGDEIVVLDNYFFTTDYQRAIKAKGCQLVCIDDMHDKHYVADMIINHGAVCSEDFDAEPYTKYCLGSKYALLRRPFLEHGKGKHAKGVYVICFGGSDQYNLTKKYIDILLETRQIQQIYAIVGDGYKFVDSISHFIEVKVLKNQTAQQMASILLESEAILCSASSICREAMACGTRVYAGWYVDNQQADYELLKMNKFINPLGFLIEDSTLKEADIDKQNLPSYNKEIIKRYIKEFSNLSNIKKYE